jgi:2-phospho-L-lactate/phosphoenolpyruvate guanylyltransferase
VRTIAVLPVKGFASAKQRLTAGLTPRQRQALAEAMFRDVLAALARSTRLDTVYVVTAGSRARAIARERGVRVLADAEQGHNAAALVGIAAALEAGADRVLLVPGDCPALDPGEIDDLLSRPAGATSVLIVPDRHGTGTNALLLAPPDALPPSFGPGSCERHATLARDAGVRAEVVEVPSLSTDIDTPEDLDALEALLGSAETAAVATRRLLGSLTLESKC